MTMRSIRREGGIPYRRASKLSNFPHRVLRSQAVFQLSEGNRFYAYQVGRGALVRVLGRLALMLR